MEGTPALLPIYNMHWLPVIHLNAFLLYTAAAPIILVIIPLIVDMATGHAAQDDIIVRRGTDISL